MSKEQSLQAEPAATTADDQAAMRIVRRGELTPSRTNPRTHFDQAYLGELASSIRLHKVLQPLLVRPLPSARLQDTFTDRQPGAPLPTLEIVCGECRWRACGLAEEDAIPVLIRHLDDVQVLQVQLVENLKRRDLHPLEEAEGFERLIKDHGMTVDDIAAKVDKSGSYIYKSLKLLELTPECREEMFAGKLNRSVALLVARAPADLQAQIAKDVMATDWQGEPLSFRAAAKLVQERYMLLLSTAVFDIKDAALVAKAGDCASCPKRTGANTDLFADVDKPDTCTDPKCFHNKQEAHYAKVAKEAKARGQTVIQGKEAKEVMPYGTSSLKGYKLLDESQYIEGRTTTMRRAIGKENMPVETVIIVDPHSNKPMEALPIAVADRLLKKAAAAKKPTQKEPNEHDLKEQYDTAWRAKAVREIFARVTSGRGEAYGVGVARQIALYLCQDLYAEDAALVAELLGVGKVAKGNGIETHIRECAPELVAPALLLVALSKDLEAPAYGNGDTPFIDVLAKDTGVDVKAIQAGVKQEMKAAAAARKAEAAEKAAPKKPAPKTTADPARAASTAFMTLLTVSAELAAVVGQDPLPRTEIISRLWSYIKKNNLQDQANKRMVNADDKLRPIFGKDQVSMFEMANLIASHVGGAAVKKTRAKKASTAEAKAGIAQALQQQPVSANDFKVGDSVRFKQDLKGPTGHLRKVCGRDGTVECQHGDRGWMVRYGKGKTDIAGADYTELEHVDGTGDDAIGTGAIELANGTMLEPQAAWPFPKDPKPALDERATLKNELAFAEAHNNKYRTRLLRNRIAKLEAPAAGTPASADTAAAAAPNAAAAAWPFPTTPKKARKGAVTAS